MNWREYTRHPLNVYPEMQDTEFEDLKQSMKDNGYFHKHPVILYDGGIIDGFHRHKAAIEVGVVPTFEEYVGTPEEAAKYIVATNTRRSISVAQKAKAILDISGMVEAIMEEAKLRWGNQYTKELGDARDPKQKTSDKLAEMAGIGSTSMKQIQYVKKHNADLYNSIDTDGNLSARKAYQLAKEQQETPEQKLEKRAIRIINTAVQEALQNKAEELKDYVMKELKENGECKLDIKLTFKND